jgi:hypothetical protein
MIVLVFFGTGTAIDRCSLNKSEEIQSLKPCFNCSRAWRLVFFGKVGTFAQPLVGTDLSLVQYILALPDTCKEQVPEIAVNEMLKANANDIHFLGCLQVRPQPEKEQVLLSLKTK